MSFPKQTRSALKAGSGSASLGQQVLRSGDGPRFLDVGEHDVRVKVVDRNQLGDNKLTVTYEAGGLEHNDMIYWLEQNRQSGEWELSRRVRNTLAALLPDKDALDAFFAEVEHDNVEVLDLLVGLSCKIQLKAGKGYRIDRVQGSDGNFYYEAKDAQTGESLEAPVYDDVNALRDWLKAEGLKRSFPNVWRYIGTSGAANVERFAKGLGALREPKASTPAFFAQKKPVAKDVIPF